MPVTSQCLHVLMYFLFFFSSSWLKLIFVHLPKWGCSAFVKVKSDPVFLFLGRMNGLHLVVKHLYLLFSFWQTWVMICKHPGEYYSLGWFVLSGFILPWEGFWDHPPQLSDELTSVLFIFFKHQTVDLASPVVCGIFLVDLLVFFLQSLSCFFFHCELLCLHVMCSQHKCHAWN